MRLTGHRVVELDSSALRRLETAYLDDVPMVDLERRFGVPQRRIVQLLTARGVPLRTRGVRVS